MAVCTTKLTCRVRLTREKSSAEKCDLHNTRVVSFLRRRRPTRRVPSGRDAYAAASLCHYDCGGRFPPVAPCNTTERQYQASASSLRAITVWTRVRHVAYAQARNMSLEVSHLLEKRIAWRWTAVVLNVLGSIFSVSVRPPHLLLRTGCDPPA